MAPALFKYVRRSLRMWLRRARTHAAEMATLAEEGGQLDTKAAVEMPDELAEEEEERWPSERRGARGEEYCGREVLPGATRRLAVHGRRRQGREA